MHTTTASNKHSVWEILIIFLRLGCTSFGGPIAHLGYFRDEFVVKRNWLSNRAYADLVALAQFLPGPSSSQVGLAIGLSRGGFAGAIAAWTGFTLPSAIAMVLFAFSITAWGNGLPTGTLHALKIVAVAVVAQAVWGMAKTLCAGSVRLLIMATTACVLLFWADPWAQIIVIAVAAVAGMSLLKPAARVTHDALPIAVSRRIGIVCLILFFALLVVLPAAAALWPNHTFAVLSSFYRAGSLVFGGGHVILPLLQAAVVPTGWVSNELFLAGYGAAQAVPGPLFTFAAYLGAVMTTAPNGVAGAALCLLAVYVPSFLLVGGALPFWDNLQRSPTAQAALSGVNAAVVGILLAALYNPVWTSAIHTPIDMVGVLLAFVCLAYLKLPPWMVVTASGVIGFVFAS